MYVCLCENEDGIVNKTQPQEQDTTTRTKSYKDKGAKILQEFEICDTIKAGYKLTG